MEPVSKIYHGGKTTRLAHKQKKHKQNVILSAGERFNLTQQEIETLANKAGLSLHFDNEFNKYLIVLIELYPKKTSTLPNYAVVSKRMYQYIKSGVIPTKETLLAIALSIGLNVDAIQILLKKAGYILSMSLPNDAVILWALENVQTDINRLQYINEILYDLEMPLLMTRTKNLKSQN